jgi:hypothetical protein
MQEGKIICMLCAHVCSWSIGKWDFCIHDCFFKKNVRENCLSCIHIDYDFGCEMPFLCVWLKSPVLRCLRETIKSYKPQIKNSQQTGPNWRSVYSPKLFSNFYVIILIKIIEVIRSRITRGGRYGSYGREERCILTFGGENLRKEPTWET